MDKDICVSLIKDISRIKNLSFSDEDVYDKLDSIIDTICNNINIETMPTRLKKEYEFLASSKNQNDFTKINCICNSALKICGTLAGRVVF